MSKKEIMNMKNARVDFKNKIPIYYKSSVFYIKRTLAEEYEKEVRPLEEAGVNYIFVAFDIPFNALCYIGVVNAFEDALIDEIEADRDIRRLIETNEFKDMIRKHDEGLDAKENVIVLM